jgi:hypothetical protein
MSPLTIFVAGFTGMGRHAASKCGTRQGTVASLLLLLGSESCVPCVGEVVVFY